LAHFRSALIPGRKIVLDETMLKNSNIDNADCIIYIPHKPVPFGHQLWTVADAMSKVVVNFELNEGKERTRQAEFFANYSVTTVTTL
jgi:hypothetical protein